MNTNVIQLTEKIAYLNHKHLEELQLFVEFLLNKQQKQSTVLPVMQKRRLLSGIQPIHIPVSEHIIQRDSLYEDRLQF